MRYEDVVESRIIR